MAITLNQHRRGITQTLIATFSDEEEVRQGFQAFFPSVTTASKYVSIEVERSQGLVAVDVQRCTDPHRNIFSHSMEKIFQPPYYNESFDFTACQRYDETFARGNAPTRIDAQFLLRDASDKIRVIKNKILRAIEIQRAQVLQTGIVTLKNGDSIDYKRQASSMVVRNLTNAWGETTSSPLADLATGMTFLREEGRSGAVSINAIMGATAFTEFMAHPEVKGQAEWVKINRMELNMPQFDKITGLVFHGRIAAGDYAVNIWTYNNTYKDPADNQTTVSYLNPQNVILVADDFKGKTAFAGVPAIFKDEIGNEWVGPKEGEFYIRDVIDQRKAAWEFIINSAPLAVPVSIDRIYTIKTVTT